MLLPVVLLISVLVMSISGSNSYSYDTHPFDSDPPYSLDPDEEYTVKRTTPNAVTYYVKQDFETEYRGSLHDLEKGAEELSMIENKLYGDNESFEETMIDELFVAIFGKYCLQYSNQSVFESCVLNAHKFLGPIASR